MIYNIYIYYINIFFNLHFYFYFHQKITITNVTIKNIQKFFIQETIKNLKVKIKSNKNEMIIKQKNKNKIEILIIMKIV